MAGPHQVGAGRLAGAHQVAGGLVCRIGHPHRAELARTQGACQEFGQLVGAMRRRRTTTSPVASSISPATTLLACTSRPTKVPSPIPAPPVTVALPPGSLPAATHDHA